jgi:drug/metabolite transporter (DMT)-like permease
MTPVAHRPSTLAVAAALGTVYVIWGSTYLAIAYVVESMPPLLSAGARFTTAGVMLISFVVAQDRWRAARGLPRRHAPRWPRAIEWRSAFIIGALLLLGGNGMVSIAEQTIPSGIAAVMIATIPIWLSVFDAALTRRMPSLLAIGGLLVGLVGVAILLLPSAGHDSLNTAGIGILVVAAVSWAAGSHYARRGPLPANQLLGTGMEQLAGGVVLLVVAAAVGEIGAFDPGKVTSASLMGLAFLVVFGSLAAFTAYVWLLNHVAVTTVATYAYVNPVVAVALGVAFRHEALSLRSMLAAALIIGAVVAMVSGRPREVEEAGPAPETGPLEPESEAT